MGIKTFVAQLLVLQGVAAFFMALVLIRQTKLFNTRIQVDMIWYRRVLFGLTCLIFLCTIGFMSINVLTLTDSLVRSADRVNAAGIVYGYLITAVVSFFSILSWLLYRMAAKILIYRNDDKTTVKRL